MELRPGYKDTEVGAIPRDWNVDPCRRVSKAITVGIVVKPAQYYQPYGVPALRSANIRANKIDETDLIFISEKSNAKLAKSQLQAGDVVTVRTGYPGTSAVIPSHLAGANCIDILITRPSEALVPSFLAAWINSSHGKDQVLRSQNGLAQQHFNVGELRELLVVIPPEAEQRAIATALGDTDALIDGNDRLIAKKHDLKQAATQQLLTGRYRLPAFAGDWDEKPLSFAIAGLDAGVSVNSVDGESESNEPAVLKTSAVENGVFLPAECKKIASRDIHRARLSLRADSILISRMNTIDLVGECGYVSADYPNLFVPDRLWMTRFHPQSRVSAKWLSYVLTSSDYRNRLRTIATGTSGSMKNIAKGTFLSLRLKFPKPEEQRAIAGVLADMDAEIAALEKRREKTLALKQGMMQELLTGRTRLVAPVTNVVSLPVMEKAAEAKAKKHNWEINEAVIMGVLAKQFGKEEFPLARVRRVKLTYLWHRHREGKAEGFLKKAAGPYNPKTRYQGPEKIALKNGYVREHHNGTYAGFVAGEKVAQAEKYFAEWYGEGALTWLEQFRFEKTEELELLATVDMAMEDLRGEGKAVEMVAVKRVVRDHPEWLPKLSREVFSDVNIGRAIGRCLELFSQQNGGSC